MSLLLLFLFACLATFSAAKFALPAQYQSEHAELQFERFIQEHNKQYVDEEEKQVRFEIFKENLVRANIMNRQSEHAIFGITKFMDISPDDFIEFFTGLGDPRHLNLTGDACTGVSDAEIPNVNAPESLDWRQYNVVTRIKNQYRCGGCYAFSASGNIEGQYAIKHKQLVELSEQQTIDCDRRSHGCSGGFMTLAFQAMIELGGIETESAYPYVNRQQACQFNPSQVAVRLAGCTSYNVASQEKLKQILYSVGPLSIAVKATNFHYYKGGVMSDQLCNSGQVNHAVLLVGYGTENGVPYWLVKNSWGEIFGEQGYIKIHRGEGAHSCGMLNQHISTSIVE